MHRRFRAWVDAKRHGRHRAPQDPEMPFLPNPRPYALTPSPSQEQIATVEETAPFFRLPLELRRRILIHAFGNRTVHMDLALNHPLNKPLNQDGFNWRSTNPAHRVLTDTGHLWPYTKENLGLDRSQPKYWQWRGCVCHRLPPPRFKITVDFHSIIKPADDRCCEGWSAACGLWMKIIDKLDSCWIGAMGWLLACRQAYTEGIEVLYGTNTISISSKPLLDNLSRLVRPSALSMMTSLEIVLYLDTHEHQGKAIPSVLELDNGLRNLDKQLPALLSLHIGVRLDNPPLPGPRYQVNRRPVHLPDMLQSIDAFVNRRCELPEFSRFRDLFLLSIPQSAYKDLQKEAEDDNRYYMRKSGSQVWRHLSSEPFELDGEGEMINATPDKGYWIWGDYEDRYELDNRPLSSVGCFGLPADVVTLSS